MSTGVTDNQWDEYVAIKATRDLSTALLEALLDYPRPDLLSQAAFLQGQLTTWVQALLDAQTGVALDAAMSVDSG